MGKDIDCNCKSCQREIVAQTLPEETVDITIQWVLNLLSACAGTQRLPRLWRQARVVALLKPGNDPSSPKSFRLISILCHLYKLYERLILNRVSGCLPSSNMSLYQSRRASARQILHCEANPLQPPVYLGVTLDRTLSFKAHLEKTK